MVAPRIQIFLVREMRSVARREQRKGSGVMVTMETLPLLLAMARRWAPWCFWTRCWCRPTCSAAHRGIAHWYVQGTATNMRAYPIVVLYCAAALDERSVLNQENVQW